MELDSSMDDRSRNIAQMGAVAGRFVAVLALAGWAISPRFLVQLSANYPPLRISGAIGLIGLAGGLDGLAQGNRRWAIASATVAVIMGLGVLAEYLWDVSIAVEPSLAGPSSTLFGFVDRTEGRMSVANALLLEIGRASCRERV